MTFEPIACTLESFLLNLDPFTINEPCFMRQTQLPIGVWVGDHYEAPKSFYEQPNTGSNRYIVRFHDGEKAYPDGSPLYDIQFFTNKIAKNAFIDALKAQGYTSRF